MREDFLPFSPPDVSSAEIDAVVEALRSDWLTTGPKVKRFEQEFGEFVDAPAALAVNSCTAALEAAVLLSDVGPGDEVGPAGPRDDRILLISGCRGDEDAGRVDGEPRSRQGSQPTVKMRVDVVLSRAAR